MCHLLFVHFAKHNNGASSGAAIFDATANEIIGIHTHGDSDRAVNSATLIAGNAGLKHALLACEAASPSPQTNTYEDDSTPH
jgi:hypothetical protein